MVSPEFPARISVKVELTNTLNVFVVCGIGEAFILNQISDFEAFQAPLEPLLPKDCLCHDPAEEDAALL